MSGTTFGRAGIFYDGSYLTFAREHYYHQPNLGWMEFRPLQSAIERKLASSSNSAIEYRVTYSAWFQGLFNERSSEEHLRRDRRLHHDLMHAGIEQRFQPMSASKKEKGVDVALSVDALTKAFTKTIDVAVLVSGDSDFVPLVQALNHQGIWTLVVHFDYQDGRYSGSICPRLARAAHSTLNISALEQNASTRAEFRALFGRNLRAVGANETRRF